MMKPTCDGQAHHFVLQRQRRLEHAPAVHAICRVCRLLWSFGDMPPAVVRYASPSEAVAFLAANAGSCSSRDARASTAVKVMAHAG